MISAPNHIPELGNDLIATIRRLLVLLWSSFGDLEAFIREDGVAGVRAATNLSAVVAVAQDLRSTLEVVVDRSKLVTYTGLAVSGYFISHITAHASTDRHFVGLR